jgi:Cu(I)/Ag(I) efflux system membrane protein CusA/SilA
MINVIFDDATDTLLGADAVLERLNVIKAQLPESVTPALGPDASGVGQIFWYTVEDNSDGKGGYSLRDLRSLQDWFIRFQLNSVPGVAEVASVGGHVQQYQIDVDPNRLRPIRFRFRRSLMPCDAVMRMWAGTWSSRTDNGRLSAESAFSNRRQTSRTS